MTISFAGTSLADFLALGSTDPSDARTVSAELAAYVAEGIEMDDDRQYRSPQFTHKLATEMWATIHSWNQGDFSANGELRFYDTSFSTSQAVLRVIQSSGSSTGWVGTVSFQAWNGSSWTNLLTSVSTGGTVTLKKYDFHYVRNDTTGSVDIYVNDVLDASVSGIDTNLAAWTSIDAVEIYLPGTSGSDRWTLSALIVGDESTIGMIMVQELPTANGANTDFTGAYTDVDELGLSTVDFLTSTTPGDISTFTGNLNAVIDTGHDIVASVISMNLINNEVSDVDVSSAYRVSSTNYENAAVTVPNGADVVNIVTALNPNTASAWTPAEIEAAEFGVVHKT